MRLKSLLLAAICGLSAVSISAPSAFAASSAAPRVIVLLVGSSPSGVNSAVFNAWKLRQAGADVKLVFQGEGLVALAAMSGKLDEDKVKTLQDADGPKEPKDRSAKYWATHNWRRPFKRTVENFASAKAAGLSVLACGASAGVLGLRDDLASAGVQMTGPSEYVDLTPWIQQGYQILTF